MADYASKSLLTFNWMLGALLPQDCLLCGGVAGEALLCPACTADLPALPGER